MKMTSREAIRLTILVAIAAVAVVHVVLLPMPSAPDHLSDDGRQYLAGAESILREGRYLDIHGKPQQVWPPGTSLLYAGVSRVTGNPPLEGVPAINVLAFLALSAAAVAFVIVNRFRIWIAALTVAAILCNGVIVAMQNKFWSEPPTLALLVLLLLSLSAALANPARAKPLLIAACACAAAAILFRYAMLAAIPLVMIVALLLRRWVFVFAAPLAVVPALAALSILGASRGERGFVWNGTFWNENAAAFLTLSDQVFPARLGLVAAILFTACCLILPLVADRRGPTAVAWLWSVGYGAFLLLAQAFAYPSFIPDARILTLLYIGAILATASACEAASRTRSKLAYVLALALLLAAARGMKYTITQMTPLVEGTVGASQSPPAS